MKIILNKDVYNLGEEGDVCEVANGYARNFLLPQQLAVPYNNANVALFRSKEAAINKRKEEKRAAAMSLKERLEGLELTIKASAGESGKLFGAVTSQTIAEALAKEGIQIERKNIDVPSNTIKMIGEYNILIKLYEKESATIKVSVVDENRQKQEQQKAAEQASEKAQADQDEQEEVEKEPEEPSVEETETGKTE
ncbi:MAG: 50S ribosomal protein L9 [Spirochaetota bacterium]